MRHATPSPLWLSVLTLAIGLGQIASLLDETGATAAEPSPILSQTANTWVKLSPLPDGPVSPRLGYEGACVWDNRHQLLVRYGGHNQGGGGEQHAEVWTFDPRTAVWTLKEPNTSPPGVCCNAQNVYDPTIQRYIRFPFFSGSHGWQWERELYLNDSSVWTYDLTNNRWRNMRPLPTPRMAPYRSASWDSDHQVVVVFGGEGSHEGTRIYDPWRNEWRWPKPEVEPEPRSGGTMAYDAARKLHVLFGSQFSDDAHTWAYDVARNQWRDMRPDPMPPTKENDAVLTYDPVHRVVLALVKVTTGNEDQARHELQTWAYDAGANRWTRMNPAVEPDAGGNRTRNLVFAPELNLAILENCLGNPREQQVWAYRYAETQNGYELPSPKRRDGPPIVEDVVVSVMAADRVEVSWLAPAIPAVRGYHVERAVVEVWSEDQLRRLKARTPSLVSPSVGAIHRIGPFQRLTETPIQSTSFVDQQIDLSRPQVVEGDPVYEREMHRDQLDVGGRLYRWGVYAYRIRVVGDSDAESGPSPATCTIPASPQHLFSREDGTACQLKWAADPTQAVAGYRVYRMDGRWDKDPVSRLMEDPVAEPAFTDPTAGKSTRRYYVVAVDRLGQEGFPSSPVWFRREWQHYYEPFVGPWHQ
ncbi:MAG: hypothetical protein KJ000_08575 [Pirellulaceae bacterium]|nr:hypothetical protein [Pirellulaceae bacterium]